MRLQVVITRASLIDTSSSEIGMKNTTQAPELSCGISGYEDFHLNEPTALNAFEKATSMNSIPAKYNDEIIPTQYFIE